MSNSNSLALTQNSTLEDKKALFNIMTNAETKLSDCVNKEIEIANFVFTSGSTTDAETGEVMEQERVIIVDTEGNSYHSMSQGLVNSMHQLVAVFGEPSLWTEPLKITVVRKETKKGNTFIVQLV